MNTNFYKGALIAGTVVIMFASTGIKFERTVESGIGFGQTGNEKITMKSKSGIGFGYTGNEKVAMKSKSGIGFGQIGNEKLQAKKDAKASVRPFGRTGAEKAALKS